MWLSRLRLSLLLLWCLQTVSAVRLGDGDIDAKPEEKKKEKEEETTTTTTEEEKKEKKKEEVTTTELETTLGTTTRAPGNPMENTTAFAGNSDKDLKKELPKELLEAIKELKPAKKGLCKPPAPKSSSLLEFENENPHDADGHSDARALLQKRRVKSKGEKCECPEGTAGDSEEVDKYQDRAVGNGCDSDKGMWSSEAGPAIRFKYEAISRLFKLKNKDYRVLDWGSGCGHQLDIIAGEFGFEGVGFDLIEANTVWAKKNLKNIAEFCTLDGAGGLPFGEGSFDVVLGNGAIHHVKGFEKQCELLNKQVPRVLAPGGCAWFGYIDAGAAPSFPAEQMLGCFNTTTDMVYGAVNEMQLFGCSEYDSGSSYSIIMCKKKAETKKKEEEEPEPEKPEKPPKPPPPPDAPPPPGKR